MKKGDIVNSKKIKDTLEQIKKLYGNLGYINWSYIPEQSFDTKNKTMDLILTSNRTSNSYVQRINFEGNTKTRDKVMRREFVLEEGRVFSSAVAGQLGPATKPAGLFRKNRRKGL